MRKEVETLGIFASLHYVPRNFILCVGYLQVAYKAVMQSVTSADKAGYEALLKIYRETDVSQERTRVLSKITFLVPLFVKSYSLCLKYEFNITFFLALVVHEWFSIEDGVYI